MIETVEAPNPLGRIFIPDDRDTAFPMRQAFAEPSVEADEAVERGWRYWWADGWWGDQWYTPQCVAYAWTHWLEDGPLTHEDRAPNRNAVVDAQGNALLRPSTLYAQCQEIDEWPGTDYDGTSVRAGAKSLKARGLIDSYWWAQSVDDVVDAILTTGPVVVGTVWTDDMFDPDPQTGLIHPTGAEAGGHAYLLNGVNTQTEVFRIKNSWGRGWGIDGFAHVTFDDFDFLLRNWGEACLAVEIG